MTATNINEIASILEVLLREFFPWGEKRRKMPEENS